MDLRKSVWKSKKWLILKKLQILKKWQVKNFTRRSHTLQGSSTVEFSLIMPVLFTLFTFLIYLSFFLYNRVEITANAYICALRGSQMEQETSKKTYQYMKKESSRLMKGNLLSVRGYKEQIAVKGEKIQVTYEISQQIPGNLIFERLLSESTWNYQIVKSAKKQNPVFFIRNCRKIENLKNNREREQGKEESKNERNL